MKEKNEIMSLTHTWYYQDYIDLLHQYNGLKMQLRMHARCRSNVFDEATRYWETLQNMDYKEMFMPWAIAALILVCIEVVLGATLFRRIP